jgi:hypothetical protein
MTVNERLVESGLLDRFDDAANRRDRSAMIELLAQVEVSSDTADAILNNPAFYGY